MNKKGVEILTKVIAGIIISIPILIILFYFSSSLIGLFFPQEGSEEFFDNLVEKINNLGEKKEEVVYFVDKDHFLIGFSKDFDLSNNKKNFKIFAETYEFGQEIFYFDIEKPEAKDKCSGETCLCLCRISEDPKTCLRAGSICEPFKGYETIDGVGVVNDLGESSNQEGLFIIGRNKLILTLSKEDDTLVIKAIK